MSNIGRFNVHSRILQSSTQLRSMKATKYEFHAYLRAPPQTPLRPNPNQTKHNRQRDPESGIERDVCLGVQDAAEAGLPLCPVVDDAKRVQALQQAEHG